MLRSPRLARVRRLALLARAVGFAAGLEQSALAHEVTPPKPLVQPAPAWPDGKPYAHDVVVPVVVTVTERGVVSDVQLEASVGGAFDTIAFETARRWTFEPAASNGKPVPAKVRAIVRFVGDPLASEQNATLERTTGARRVEDGRMGPARSVSSAELGRSPADRTRRLEPTGAQGVRSPAASIDVEVSGERVSTPRSASETSRDQSVIRAAPHRTAADVLQAVPGFYITQHSGQGKAYQVFYRGFDAIHGQDLEFWVGGAPVNEVSNIHGQGYADLHFVMPEIVSKVTVLPGNYAPEQGDFAVAGTIRYDLGYAEPGVSVKGTLGSFGERRAFLAYHREGSAPESFAAFEAQSTDGFGRGRAASRTSGVAQQVIRLDHGRLRLLATGYAGRFDSPGVVRRADVEGGRLDRFSTYGIAQGGFSSRYQLVADYGGTSERADWSMAPYVIQRGLELRQNYTGYLLDETNGDSAELVNESTTLGVRGHYRHRVHWLSSNDTAEVGISVRHDWIRQSQLAVSAEAERILGTVVDAKIRAMDTAGWADLTLLPMTRLKIRAGLRVDGLAYAVEDHAPGLVRTAMGLHYGPRVTLDGLLARGLHALLSYGEGFRSPQARSLGHGEKAPFTQVRSMEAGLRYASTTVLASLAAFRTTLDHDLVFDAATTRNEAVPGSRRIGAALEFTLKPAPWFVSSGSMTWTRATFTESDRTYQAGDKLPYVPELILRQDLAFTPTLTKLWSRTLTGRFGVGLTGMGHRPQPYGTYGRNVFLVDAVTELRLEAIAFGVDVFNLLDSHWYDSEFTYSANWNPGAAARLVPERYVTVGAPRTLLATLSLFLN